MAHELRESIKKSIILYGIDLLLSQTMPSYPGLQVHLYPQAAPPLVHLIVFALLHGFLYLQTSISCPQGAVEKIWSSFITKVSFFFFFAAKVLR